MDIESRKNFETPDLSLAAFLKARKIPLVGTRKGRNFSLFWAG